MPATPERLIGWIGPKWLVAGAALAVDGVLFSYDLRLGIAASVVLAAVLALWLYLALRYGPGSGAPSGREALMAQVRARASVRRTAQARARGASGAQDRPDPAERP